VTATVIVVGSINVDLFTYVEKLPRPGETVSGGTFSRAHGGKGANQAVAAARLGARAVFVGMVGDDDLGQGALSELGRDGVELGEVRTGKSHTGVAQILVDANGENLIAVALGTNDELTASMVGESLARVHAVDAVVCSVLEIPEDAVLAAARTASERGWRFVLNPAPARALPRELLARCHVLTPNEHEVSMLGVKSPEDLLAAGAEALVVTRGAAGTDLMRAGLPPHHRSARKVNAVDTTGAGDAFSGSLAWALAEGESLERAVEVATVAGALSTLRPGARAGMPTRAELEGALGQQ
jgi:ribokinase